MESKQLEILQDSGVNEMEIMVFTISDKQFGIKVSQVQEIMKTQSLVGIQKSNEYIEGIFKPREKVVTVINLPAFLDLPASEKPQRDIFIMTEFNDSEYAFHVHTVVGIDRISCSQMKEPDPVIFAGKEKIASGIVEHDNQLITIIDFEAVIGMICSEKDFAAIEETQLENF